MPDGRLDSWKEIAADLGRSVRTVQRWERQEGLEDHDRALAFLERAYEEMHVGALSIKQDPEFDPVRADPRFQELLRRVGLS